MYISKRAQLIGSSSTLAINAKVKKLKQKLVDIVNFGVGEPDFNTADNVKNSAIRAINENFTKYCPVAGTLEIKNSIINKFKRDNKLNYSHEEIIVSNGAKHSLYNFFQSVIDPGDEVIIPAPYWVSYPDMVILAGGKPVIVRTDEKTNFKITSADIEKVLTSKTKVVVINSPSNPTGFAYTVEELKAIGQTCVKNKLLIVSDEIYEKFVYDDFKFTSIAKISPNIKKITTVVNGVSKTYSMTGWRIGYAAGAKDIIEAMTKIQSQSTSNASSISIKAAIEALDGTQEYVESMRNEFKNRRNYLVERLNAIKNVICIKPKGAFYIFLNIKTFLGRNFSGKIINTDVEFANYLLDVAKIAVIPGSAFGIDGYIRFSYAVSMGDIKKGIDRLEKILTHT
ncbi:MAG: pyridoxal phosphate-dependent aminotransferase [Endomicrobium sp.]|jgi:aspartate aminotransferase|nr:pyridoxal phosphate-dependent aminotransferase [Endomicrobium sp.]